MLKKPVFFVVCAALAITNLSATIAQTGVQSHAPSLRSTWQINQYATPSTLKVQPASTSGAPNANVPGKEQDDFANRVGAAKDYALNRTGGSVKTEAAVDAALRYSAQSQRADGAWDPNTTGAGEERSPLGENRGGAGRRSETAITGLALLALMGAGNTHQRGEYADEVYAGLAYLIKTQRRDGSLSGDSSVYAATYCHGIAALAMCEAAAITKDPSAMTGAQRSIQFTFNGNQ